MRQPTSLANQRCRVPYPWSWSHDCGELESSGHTCLKQIDSPNVVVVLAASNQSLTNSKLGRSMVTPKRPTATWLIADFMESLLDICWQRAESSLPLTGVGEAAKTTQRDGKGVVKLH